MTSSHETEYKEKVTKKQQIITIIGSVGFQWVRQIHTQWYNADTKPLSDQVR